MPRGDAQALLRRDRASGERQDIPHGRAPRGRESDPPRKHLLLARFPSVFVHCRPESRLSHSLHCSDHKKAQVIGRKLNTRLAELKMNLKEQMSRQQLQKLFEDERDKEPERLYDINTLTKRNGRGGDVVEMEIDLEAGWACQLVAKFGMPVELALENGCAGLGLAKKVLREVVNR